LDVEGATTDRIGDIAAEHGFAVHELRKVQGSLEEAFLELTRKHVEFAAPAVA
jgi:ABC-2 type transport system ATP-binding protein